MFRVAVTQRAVCYISIRPCHKDAFTVRLLSYTWHERAARHHITLLRKDAARSDTLLAKTEPASGRLNGLRNK